MIRAQAAPVGGHSRHLAAGLVVLVVAMVAGVVGHPWPSGTAGAASSGAGSGVPACGVSAPLAKLVVTRTDAFPQNRITFSFPASVTVRSAAAVERVAKALCSLPSMPQGRISCPADLGIDYHLVFTVSGKGVPPVQPVVAEATGCEGVEGARSDGQTTNGAFWTTLGRAMGLPDPTEAIFRGSGPKGTQPAPAATTTTSSAAPGPSRTPQVSRSVPCRTGTAKVTESLSLAPGAVCLHVGAQLVVTLSTKPGPGTGKWASAPQSANAAVLAPDRSSPASHSAFTVHFRALGVGVTEVLASITPACAALPTSPCSQPAAPKILPVKVVAADR